MDATAGQGQAGSARRDVGLESATQRPLASNLPVGTPDDDHITVRQLVRGAEDGREQPVIEQLDIEDEQWSPGAGAFVLVG